jgi:trigger factor
VRVTEIKQESLPELDDEFVRGVNPDIKTVALFRERVSADLKLKAEEKARIDFEERVIEAVADLTELEFPPILVEMEINRLLNEQSRRLQMGGQGLEEYLKSQHKTEVELREELQPLATKMVIRSLVLVKVTEEEKIESSDSEVDAEIENMVKSTTDHKDKLQNYLNTPQSRESIEQLLITRKAIQRLVEIAKGSSIDVKAIKKEGRK